MHQFHSLQLQYCWSQRTAGGGCETRYLVGRFSTRWRPGCRTRWSGADDGTGYGLSIVRTDANGHGRDVTATDGTAGGARFDVTGIQTTEEPGIGLRLPGPVLVASSPPASKATTRWRRVRGSPGEGPSETVVSQEIRRTSVSCSGRRTDRLEPAGRGHRGPYGWQAAGAAPPERLPERRQRKSDPELR